MSSKKSSEIDRSQLDNTGNTTADVLVEVPNGTQSSPRFTLLANVPVDPLVNGSCNILQGRAPLLKENQNLGGTPPENSAWIVQTDGDSSHSLPPALPPTGISCMTDPIGSFWPASDGPVWPLSPTDTNWQLDFDLAFTSEPNSASTGATSSTLGELDLFQLYNLSTQGCDSAGVSRDLIEYLSLGEKVSTNATIPVQHGSLYRYLYDLGVPAEESSR